MFYLNKNGNEEDLSIVFHLNKNGKEGSLFVHLNKKFKERGLSTVVFLNGKEGRFVDCFLST